MQKRQLRKAAVVGLGRFGRSVALRLTDLGVEVIAVDLRMQVVEEIKDIVAIAAQADATRREALRELAVNECDILVVAVGENFEVNIMVTAIGQDLGIPQIITRAESPLQKDILEHVGATRVLYVEQDMGVRLAQSLVFGDVLDFMDLPESFGLRSLAVPGKMAGRRLGDLELRRRHGISVVSVIRFEGDGPDRKRVVHPVPGGDFRFEQGDFIAAVGLHQDLEKWES